jgi:hypothetical protein
MLASALQLDRFLDDKELEFATSAHLDLAYERR